MKTRLLNYLKQDVDFKPYLNILNKVVDGIDINDYRLDIKYQDISYIVIDDVIINLDEIYFLCRDFND